MLFLVQLESIRSIQSGRILFFEGSGDNDFIPLFNNFWKFSSNSISFYQILRLFLFYFFILFLIYKF